MIAGLDPRVDLADQETAAAAAERHPRHETRAHLGASRILNCRRREARASTGQRESGLVSAGRVGDSAMSRGNRMSDSRR
jgi:hypothetical protein